MVPKLTVTAMAVLCLWAASVPAVFAGSPTGPAGATSSLPPSGVVSSPAPDIHDIRPPRQVGVNPVIYYWLWGGFLAGAVLIALYLIIRRLRHRKDRIPQEVNASIYEPPDQEALRLLEELEKDTDLLPVDYFFRLSAIFRLYIKRRFGIDAPEMTTEELMPEFRRLELDQGKRDGIKSFLLFSDGVKFAKAACDRDRMTQYLNFVRKLVKETSVPRQPASENLEG